MDAQMVVKAIQDKNYPRNYWGNIARRGEELLTRRQNEKLAWVRCSGNWIAHHLDNLESMDASHLLHICCNLNYRLGRMPDF
ncbi:hypothetical protein P8452_50452 [Trifolium repens]|nr:hypothetical protein P8452_50452 [Trifolium repens]